MYYNFEIAFCFSLSFSHFLKKKKIEDSYALKKSTSFLIFLFIVYNPFDLSSWNPLISCSGLNQILYIWIMTSLGIFFCLQEFFIAFIFPLIFLTWYIFIISSFSPPHLDHSMYCVKSPFCPQILLSSFSVLSRVPPEFTAQLLVLNFSSLLYGLGCHLLNMHVFFFFNPVLLQSIFMLLERRKDKYKCILQHIYLSLKWSSNEWEIIFFWDTFMCLKMSVL